MKKILLSLLVLSAIAFTSCKPEPVNYTDSYVGMYNLSMTPSLTFLGLEGLELTAFAATECEISKVSNDRVKVYIYDGSKIDCVINGTCDENGLHLENFEYSIYDSEYVEEYDYQLGLTIDLLLGGVTVNRQHNGNISWVSPIIVGSLELEAFGETMDGGSVIGSMSFMGIKN